MGHTWITWIIEEINNICNSDLVTSHQSHKSMWKKQHSSQKWPLLWFACSSKARWGFKWSWAKMRRLQSRLGHEAQLCAKGSNWMCVSIFQLTDLQLQSSIKCESITQTCKKQQMQPAQTPADTFPHTVMNRKTHSLKLSEHNKASFGAPTMRIKRCT